MSPTSDQGAHMCCAAVRDELRQRLSPAEPIFFGPELALRDEPNVARLRARGAHFFWVAVPVGGAPFWNAHVGVVVDPATLAGTVGIHRGRHAEMAAQLFANLAPTFESHRLSHYSSEAADEEQWNSAPLDLSSSSGVDEACRQIIALLEVARTGGHKNGNLMR